MGTASASMFDISNRQAVERTANKTATQSTNKKAGESLQMEDFLTLMVAMFQNQDIDNAASTTDMMNQFVQMSVVQAITNISTLIDDSTVMTYAASLVGKEVTIGQYAGKELKEITGVVTGTGTLNGQQVVFIGNDSYYLTDIMAVGRLPDKEDLKVPGQGDGDDAAGDVGDGAGDPGDSGNVDGTGGSEDGSGEGVYGPSSETGDTGEIGSIAATNPSNPGETVTGVTGTGSEPAGDNGGSADEELIDPAAGV